VNFGSSRPQPGFCKKAPKPPTGIKQSGEGCAARLAIASRTRRNDSRQNRRRNRQLDPTDRPSGQRPLRIHRNEHRCRDIASSLFLERPGCRNRRTAQHRVSQEHREQPAVAQAEAVRCRSRRSCEPRPDRPELDRKRDQNHRPRAPGERPHSRVGLSRGGIGPGCQVRRVHQLGEVSTQNHPRARPTRPRDAISSYLAISGTSF